MASISTSIAIYDKVSAPINNMIGALTDMCDAFESVERSMGKGFDTSKIVSARAAIDKAADSVVQLGRNTDRAEDEQEQYNKAVKGGTSAMSGLLSKVTMLAGTIGLGKVVKDAIDFASDLQEVQNVVDVAFGTSSKKIDEWATTTLNAYGLNELSAKKYAGTLGAMLKSSGLAGETVDEMSMKITELAGDMASFYNLEGEDAFNKLRSGISGETEPLKQLGINMSVANLEAYALSQGIQTAYNEMSQAEQTMLRYNYLMQATADAQGDFARTSDSFSNQTKLLKENWKAFTGELANGILPSLSEAIGKLNGAIQWMSENSATVSAAIIWIGDLLIGVLDTVASIAKFVISNWSMIAPIIFGIVGALVAYKLATMILSGYLLLHELLEKRKAAAQAMATGKTFAETAAQYGLNAALYACPLTWIILLIIAVIAVIYLVVAAINKVTGSTLSATGIICGALSVAGAFIYNLFVALINGIIQLVWNSVEPFLGIIEWILNACNGGFTSFGGAVANLIGQIISWFLSLGKVVTTIIDAIFGTDWTGGLTSLQDKVTAWGKDDEKAITISREAPTIKRMEYGDAWDSGYKFGEGITEKFNFDMSQPDTSEYEALANKGYSGANTLAPETYGGSGGYDVANAPANIANTADNTDKMADSLDISSEDLKYLHDVAERDVINRFTTAEIKVEMTNNNNISSDADLDGIVDYLVNGVSEAMEIMAEGVPA